MGKVVHGNVRERKNEGKRKSKEVDERKEEITMDICFQAVLVILLEINLDGVASRLERAGYSDSAIRRGLNWPVVFKCYTQSQYH